MKCECCGGMVTTETEKKHLQAKFVSPNLMHLRSKLRRHSSMESIRARRARSLAASPPLPLEPIASPVASPRAQSPNPPNLPIPDVPAPEIDFGALWADVMQACPIADLDEKSSTHESIPASFISTPDSDASAQDGRDASFVRVSAISSIH